MFFQKAWQAVSNNLGTKAISVIVALVLWVVVLGSRNVEVVKEVPLELITPTELVAGNDVPEKIAFRLSGPKAFLRSLLDRQDEPIRVNLSAGKPGLNTYRFFQDNIRLPIGVKVVSITPPAILVKLEYVKRRDVPVKLETLGELPEGRKLIHAELSPPVVRIKGAESRIDSVTELSTLPLDLAGVRESLEREIGLDIARHGVMVDGPLPRVLLEVESVAPNRRIRNVQLRVLVSGGRATVAEKTVTFLVRATAEDLRSLDPKQVYGVLDLRGRPKGKYQVVPRAVLPAGVHWVKTVPEQVSVTLD